MNPLNWKKIFISGVIFAILAITLAVVVYLVLKPQSQSVTSKAATSCIQKWPADPNTDCGRSTQSPKQGEVNVSLTPNFHWDYGGYPSGSCTRSSGCSNYSASVYLWKGNCSNCSDSNLIATCGLAAKSDGPYTDAPFSCFGLGALQPNTAYTWRPTPRGDNLVHAEQNWNYTFTTGATSSPPPIILPPPTSTIDCVSLTTTADLNNLQVGILYDFTLTTGGNASISSVNMPVYMNSCTNQVFGDAPLRGISGTNTYNIKWRPTQSGSFVAYGKVSGGGLTCQADCGGTACSGSASCKLTGTVKTPPPVPPVPPVPPPPVPPPPPPPASVATCQRVAASKDLSAIKIGDTVTFTGYGNMTNPPTGDAINKINFIILKDGVSVSNTEVNTILESAGVWKATKDFMVTMAGSYSVRIRVHWLSKNVWLE